eukprot:TRINITY_DN61929_c0_g1_i1.p1 TRINITY_DN61929_c0_g1~~TRINITY_DN61929_c0_g1_i1.p1  ORF type:complete len:331 (+),score=56.14 TRINITY_DN61929_c0_g1_i1:59-1051(+)
MAVAAVPEQLTDERRLYISYVPRDVTEDEVREVFGVYGEITDVRVSRAKDGSSLTSGFVTFQNIEDATGAMLVLSEMYKFREDCPETKVAVARPRGSKGQTAAAVGSIEGGGRDYGSRDYSPAPNTANTAPAHAVGASAGDGWLPPPPPVPAGGSAIPSPASHDSLPIGSSGPPAARSDWRESSSEWDQSSSWRRGSQGGSSWGSSGVSNSRGTSWERGGGCSGGGWSSPGQSNHSGQSTKLWIGNLPGHLSEEGLRTLFGAHGPLVEVRKLPVKSNTGQACAFITYVNSADADTALNVKQDYEIEPGMYIKVERPSDRPKGGSKGYRPY